MIVVILRPLVQAAVLVLALTMLFRLLGPGAPEVLAWVIVVLVLPSPVMAGILLEGVRRHPEGKLLAANAEIAVLVSFAVLLIAMAAANFLVGGPRGFGYVPLITAIILLELRPLPFIIGRFRGRW